METLMVFVLIVTHKNEPTGEEFYFQELTSCLEYSLALNTQNVNNILGTNASRQTSPKFKPPNLPRKPERPDVEVVTPKS